MKALFALLGLALLVVGGVLFMTNIDSPAITLTAPLLIALIGAVFLSAAGIMDEIAKSQK